MTTKPAVFLLVAGLVGSFLKEANAQSPPESSLTSENALRDEHWGINFTTPDFIRYFGYPVEIHHVTTPDGYILELHRIPHGLAGPSENRPVALLEHCLLCSSADYVMNDPGEALAYILADAGYDVWLGNMRGNTYARNHTTLDPDELKFWKFSWDDIAVNDIPTSIDYVLEKTGSDGVYYVGWSMGTTVFWVMMSEQPEYNTKIKAMAALAPVAFVENAIGPIKVVSQFTDQLTLMMDLLGVGEFLPSSEFMDYLVENFCDMNATSADLCYNFLFLMGGPDDDELNKEYLPVILSHTPAGSSVHTVAHYGQMMNSGEFCKYDFGYLGNMNHYGQATPPVFDLGKVTAPVGLFWGNTDYLADPIDVARLSESLPNLALSYNVPKEEWSHFDFGWAKHANEYVYVELLDFFSKH